MNPVSRFWIMYNVCCLVFLTGSSLLFLQYVLPIFRQRPVTSGRETMAAKAESRRRLFEPVRENQQQYPPNL